MAWNSQALTGVQLAFATSKDTRTAMEQRFPGCRQQAAPGWVLAGCAAVADLLQGDSGAHARLLALPLDMACAPAFHQSVWEQARCIPPGQTLSYGEFAALLGKPGAARAVGQALGANPFAPVVPCHRVLAKDLRSGGFSAPGGVQTKLRLLELEHARFGAPGLFDAL